MKNKIRKIIIILLCFALFLISSLIVSALVIPVPAAVINMSYDCTDLIGNVSTFDTAGLSNTSGVEGIADTALRNPDASDNRYCMSTNSHILAGKTGTVSCWFNQQSGTTSGRLFDFNSAPATTSSGLHWLTNNAGHCGGLDCISYYNGAHLAGNSIITGFWYHILMKVNSTGTYAYEDGVLVNSNSVTSWAGSSTDELTFFNGYANDIGGGWTGNLDECYIWVTDDITQEMITILASNTSDGFYPFTSDTPPTIPTSATVSNSTPKTNDIITCNASGSTDSESITYHYKWNESAGTLQDWSDNDTIDCTISGCDKSDTITCYAKATTTTFNSSVFEGESFTVQNTEPSITLISPVDGKHDKVNISATFSVLENDADTVSCSLYVDSIINSTNSSVDSSITTVLYGTLEIDGTYSWYINCTDSEDITLSSTRSYVFDTEPPFINIYYPSTSNNTITQYYNLILNATIEDPYVDVTNVSLMCESGTYVYTNTTTWTAGTFINITDNIDTTSCGEQINTIEVCARDSLTDSPIIQGLLNFAYTTPGALTSLLEPVVYIDYNYMINGSDYITYFKDNPTFGQVISSNKGGFETTFQPMALNYRNDLSQIEQVSMIQSVTGIPDADGVTFIYPNAYGVGFNLTYESSGASVKERLIIGDFNDLLVPASYILAGGNVHLDLDFLIETDSNHVVIDGEDWDKSSELRTSNSASIKDDSGNVLYVLAKPMAYDSAGNSVELNYLFKKTGASLFIVIETSYSFLTDVSTVYPVFIDPTITYVSNEITHETTYNMSGVVIKRTLEYLDESNTPLVISNYGIVVTDEWVDNGRHIKTDFTINKVDVNQNLYKLRLTYECVDNCEYMEYLDDRNRDRIIDNNRNIVYQFDDAILSGWNVEYSEVEDVAIVDIVAPNAIFYDGLSSTFIIDPITGGLNTECSSSTYEVNFPPTVLILTPDNDSNHGGDFNVTWNNSAANQDAYITNVTINGSVVSSTINSTTTSYQINTSVYLDGSYDVIIESCEDSTTVPLCSSDIITIYIDTSTPLITMISPINSLLIPSHATSFTYNVSDDLNVTDCLLYMDSTLINTEINVNQSIDHSFSKDTIASGIHTWYVVCNDTLNNVGTSSTEAFIIDTTSLDTGSGSGGSGSGGTGQEIYYEITPGKLDIKYKEGDTAYATFDIINKEISIPLTIEMVTKLNHDSKRFVILPQDTKKVEFLIDESVIGNYEEVIEIYLYKTSFNYRNESLLVEYEVVSKNNVIPLSIIDIPIIDVTIKDILDKGKAQLDLIRENPGDFFSQPSVLIILSSFLIILVAVVISRLPKNS